MKLELAYPTPVIGGVPTPYNLSRTTPTWFSVSNDDIVGLNELHLECTKEEGNQVKRKMTGDLLFYDNVGGVRTMLLNAFYNTSTPIDYMWVRIYDCDCKEWIFKGQITRDKLEWCSGGTNVGTSNCFVRCRATEYDEVTDAYNSLNNILNYDAYEADPLEHYINIPNVDTSAFVVETTYQPSVRVGGLLKNSIASLPEFKFVSSILESPTGLNGWTGDLYGVDMSVYSLMSWDGAGTVAMPMGNTNPYHYTYLLNCDITKGKKLSLVGDFISEEHRYVKTIKDFLRDLTTVFNADYLVKKVGTDVHFVFERKDYFHQYSTVWKDCTAYNVCFQLDNRNRYSYADIRFSTPSSFFGEEGTGYASLVYRLIKEWNNPVSPIQKDSYSALNTFAGIPCSRSQELQLQKKYISTPPALLIPGAVQLGFGDSIGTYDLPNYTNRVFDQNRPFYVIGDVLKAAFPSVTASNYYNCNLYDCFHFIENPRNAPNNLGYTSRYSKKYLRFEVEVQYTCAEYLAFSNDSAVLIDVFGTPTKGTIENVDFDVINKTCKITGTI
jgi:hypothetical protein